MVAAHRIRVGIGGWSYEPWRETFYPSHLKAKQELEYASRQVTAIEINSTFYRLQNPGVFAKWRDSTPENFVFSLKSPRFITHRRELALGIVGATRFIDSGIAELRHKLGPIVWQLPPTHEFEPEDLDAFLSGIPRSLQSIELRHALNVRHQSFRCKEFVAMARRQAVAVVYEDDDHHPAIGDVTSEFVYARLRRSVASEPTGYSKPALMAWREVAYAWSRGEEPSHLPAVTRSAERTPRDVFIYFINGAKERAPAAARQLLEYLGESHQ